MKRFLAPLLALAMMLALLPSCAQQAVVPEQPQEPVQSEAAEPAADAAEAQEPFEPEPEPEPEPVGDPYDAVRNYWKPEQLTQAWGPDQVVEHLFFHPIIAYPKYAFYESGASESQRYGLDDWMVTVDEYNKIL